MDQSKALQKLLEAADLTKMIEDLMDPSRSESILSSSSGIRITLKNIRETILSSQGVLAKDFVARARSNAGAQQGAPLSSSVTTHKTSSNGAQDEASNPVINGPNSSRGASPEIRSAQLGQRSLRSSIEQSK